MVSVRDVIRSPRSPVIDQLIKSHRVKQIRDQVWGVNVSEPHYIVWEAIYKRTIEYLYQW